MDSITRIFEGAAAKWLSAVDAEPDRSNQHELGGLPAAGFKQFLGEPPKADPYRFKATLAYLDDEADDSPEIVMDTVSWYDSRHNQPHRDPEYRLYYRHNAVAQRICANDLLVIAKNRDGTLLLAFAPPESTAANQLCQLFGVRPGGRFTGAAMPEGSLSLPLKLLLEELGIEPFERDAVKNDLEIVSDRFPGRFPFAAELSELARELNPADPVLEPDATLLAWLEREEQLFRALERHLVAERLKQGFGEDGCDVDEFISFSLSVQNRRKSRAGHAFENHLGTIFSRNALPYEKGSNTRVTENKAKPDFLFPGFAEYHDPTFPVDNLFLLGAKTSCKDRWRQVLSEGERIADKHLATLEPGISTAQTDEMQSKNINLVIPEELHSSYTSCQREIISSLHDFTRMIKNSLRKH